MFAALGDSTRLGIVYRLSARGPLSTMSLTAATPLSRQAMSKHLQALQRVGIVYSRRSGRDRVWKLQTARFAEIRGYLAEISAQWDQAIERLRDLVEDKRK